jgi:hypothetical protein
VVQASSIFYITPANLGKFYHVLSLAHSLPSSLHLFLSVHRTIFLVGFIILVMGVIERDRGIIYCSVFSFGSGGEFSWKALQAHAHSI